MTSSLINWEMTEIGQAVWLSGSHPIRVYCHHLESIHICYFFQFCITRERFCWYTNRKVTIYSEHSSEMNGQSCVVSYKMFLLNSSVSLLEYTDRKVVPYLVIVGNPLPNKFPRFLIVYYICRA